VLGTDGKLWLEHSGNGKFGAIPPKREPVDVEVTAFQPLNTGSIYVLDDDGTLWLEQAGTNGEFGQIPPPRTHVDDDVSSFVAMPNDLFSVYVLSRDGDLWYEHVFDQPDQPRLQVDGQVAAFQPVDLLDNLYVLGTDGNLWLEHSVNGAWGKVPPVREPIDGNAMAFQAFDPATIFVLGTDGALWNEFPVHGKFGQVPPPRNPVAAQAADFQVVAPPSADGQTFQVFVLDAAGKLQFFDFKDGVITNEKHIVDKGGNVIVHANNLVDDGVKMPVAFGVVRPAYMVTALVYAPPGTAAQLVPGQSAPNVLYAAQSSTGVTTATSELFTGGVDVKATVGTGLASASLDFNASKATGSNTSVQVQKSQSNQIQPYAPLKDGIHHDYDQLWIWLNPSLAVSSSFGPGKRRVTWELGIDGGKQNIGWAYVGQLKNPPTVSRTDPQTGKALAFIEAMQNAGLTQSDYDTMLALNPFSFGPVPFDAHRYARVHEFTYEYGAAQQSAGTTLQSAQTTTNTTSTTNNYGVTATATAGVKDILSVTATFSFEWSNSESTANSDGTMQTAIATLCDPSADWNGQYDVYVYWDEYYSSFMFAFE
jgi:hypothetical protein